MTDIVSALERTGPTEIALIVFLLTFLVAVGRLLLPSLQERIRREAALPLEDAPVMRAPSKEGAGHVEA